MGPNWPFLVIHVQIWIDLGEFHVGFPIGIDGSNIAPIRHLVIAHPDATLFETLREHTIFFNQMRDHVLAKIMAGILFVGIANQLFKEELGIEYIDAHTNLSLIHISEPTRRTPISYA